MNEETVKSIVQNYNTPTYVFDIEVLRNRIKYLKEILPKNILLCYAIKANTFIIDDIENIIDRFEVCSPGEYEICNKKGIDKKKVLISGIYKTPEVIKNMIDNDKDINCYSIESIEQFELIKELSENIKYNGLDNKIDVLLRLTSGNQFGLDEKEVDNIIKDRNSFKNINIKGIHYFSGTQKISLKSINREIEYLNDYLEKLKNEFDYIPEELEYGGGFPVYYFENTEFDEDSYLKEFSEILNKLRFNGKIIIELGRSIVASCGYYLTKVVDKKINKNERYAIVDGGMNHIVYFGQSMAMKIPKCEIYPKRDNVNIENWNICGSLCTVNDILIKQYPISDLKIGDVLIFKNTGAYCMTEGISLFLSRDLPEVIKLKNNKDIIVVRKQLPTYNLNM